MSSVPVTIELFEIVADEDGVRRIPLVMIDDDVTSSENLPTSPNPLSHSSIDPKIEVSFPEQSPLQSAASGSSHRRRPLYKNTPRKKICIRRNQAMIPHLDMIEEEPEQKEKSNSGEESDPEEDTDPEEELSVQRQAPEEAVAEAEEHPAETETLPPLVDIQMDVAAEIAVQIAHEEGEPIEEEPTEEQQAEDEDMDPEQLIHWIVGGDQEDMQADLGNDEGFPEVEVEDGSGDEDEPEEDEQAPMGDSADTDLPGPEEEVHEIPGAGGRYHELILSLESEMREMQRQILRDDTLSSVHLCASVRWRYAYQSISSHYRATLEDVMEMLWRYSCVRRPTCHHFTHVLARAQEGLLMVREAEEMISAWVERGGIPPTFGPW